MLLSLALYADSTIEDLEERSRECARSPGGSSYGGDALSAFWGDLDFMWKCAPPGRPESEALSLYLVIDEDGYLSELKITPETEIAKCILRETADRKMPKPPFGDYVIKINLNL